MTNRKKTVLVTVALLGIVGSVASIVSVLQRSGKSTRTIDQRGEGNRSANVGIAENVSITYQGHGALSARSQQGDAQAAFTLARTDRDIGRYWEHLKWSFIRPEFVHPLIIKELLPWLSDIGEQVVAVNILDSQDSNRFHGKYGVVTRADGSTWVEWSAEDGRSSFAYRYLGTSPSGIHMLQCADWGGGTGVFQDIILVAFETDDAVFERSHEVGEDALQFSYEKRERIILKTLGSITLGDRYTGAIQYAGGYLRVGPDERWKRMGPRAEGQLIKVE